MPRPHISLVTLLVALATVASANAQPQGRTYKGKPLAAWVKHFHDPKANPDEAAAALLVFVPEHRAAVVEALAIAVQKGPRSSAIRALYWIGPGAKEAVPALAGVLRESKERAERSWAAEALGEIGPGAAGAVPELVAALDPQDGWANLNARDALVKVGKPAVPALIAALKGGKKEQRRLAAEILGKLGADAGPAVPVLIAAAQDKDYGLQLEATVALGRIGPAAKEAAHVLFELYKSTTADLQRHAIDALAKVGPEAKAVVPYFRDRFRLLLKNGSVELPEVFPALSQLGKSALPVWQEALKFNNLDMLSPALTALAKIGPAAKEALPAIIEALLSTDGGWAASPLFETTVEKTGSEAVPPLVTALKDKDAARRYYGALGLGSIGPKAKEAVGPLTAALRDPDEAVRNKAASALGSIGPGARPAVAALLARLKDTTESATVWRSAARALGGIGPAAREVLPDLLALHRDERFTYRGLLALALARIGPAEEKVQRALIAAVRDKDEVMRVFAAEALGEIGPAARQAVPALIKALEDARQAKWSLFGPQKYWEALGKFGPAAKDAVPVLVACLKERERDRDRIRDALIRIGPPAVPALFDCLQDHGPEVSLHAVKALSEIRPPVTVLKDALKDRRAKVRRWAAYLLGLHVAAAREVAPELLTALKDADKSVRSMAMEALGNLRADDKAVVAGLLEALKGEDHRLTAAEALIQCSADPKVRAAVVVVLLDCLNEKSFWTRSWAADLLGEVGAPAAEAVPALLACYNVGSTANSEVPKEDIDNDTKPEVVRNRLRDASRNALLRILRPKAGAGERDQNNPNSAGNRDASYFSPTSAERGTSSTVPSVSGTNNRSSPNASGAAVGEASAWTV